MLAERDPGALPWGELGVDVVIESTGLVHRPRRAPPSTWRSGAKKVDHLGARDRTRTRRSCSA